MPDFTPRSFNGGDPSLPEMGQTDRLLDALAREQPVYPNDAGEAELAYLLAGWRDEVRQPPISAVVTPRDAAIALDRAIWSTRRTTVRRRFSLAVVGSMAAAVLCLAGFGSVLYGAGPGDPLYGVRTMLFGEQQATRDDQVALAAQTQMAEVEQLIEQGDWTAAQHKLQALTTTVAAVGDTDRQQELVDQWQQLSVKVQTRDPEATVPPDAPPVVLPEVPSDLPLPALLSPDATAPSSSPAPSGSTSPATSPSSTEPSVPPADSPTTPPPATTPPVTTPPATTPPVTTPPATTPPVTTPPATTPPPSAGPSTAPSTAPSTSASALPRATSTRAPVELAPSSVPVTTAPPSAVAPPVTKVVPPTTTVAPAVADPEVEVGAPTRLGPTVERPQMMAPVDTTTVVVPPLGSGSQE